MYSTKNWLISLVVSFMLMFPLPSFALDCKSKANDGLVVKCSDGKEYALVTKEQLDEASLKMKELNLVSEELKLTNMLLENERSKNNSHEKLLEIMQLKSNEDRETIDKLLETKFQEIPWYKTSEFGFAVGLTTGITAFVLWRYTEQYTK